MGETYNSYSLYKYFFFIAGALFAAVVTIENIGSIVAAMLFNSLYAWSQRRLQFNGFVFLVCAGLLVIPLILLV